MRWTDAEGRGLEHCLLTLGPEGLTLEGVVAGHERKKGGFAGLLGAPAEPRLNSSQL